MLVIQAVSKCFELQGAILKNADFNLERSKKVFRSLSIRHDFSIKKAARRQLLESVLELLSGRDQAMTVSGRDGNAVLVVSALLAIAATAFT